MALESKRRLGRGLDALLGAYPIAPEAPDAAADAGRRTLPLVLIERNPRNPRRDFPAEDLQELANSLRQHGVVQPLVVRPAPGGAERYEIIAGERRWRAAQLAGLHEVPVTILDVTDRQALELAIVENVQRSDLNPIEEARGYEALIEEFGYTQADLAASIGKSRVHVTNTLRLLKLPPPVLSMLEAGKLSAGHGRALLGASRPQELAGAVLEKNLSVRETERLSQQPDQPARTTAKPSAPKSADLKALEKQVSDALGLNLEIRHHPSGRGEIRVSYRSLDQLDLICRKLRA